MNTTSQQHSDGLLFGAIADDFTGASDLASRLSEQGVRTLQVFGLPTEEFIDKLSGQYDAVVISLKSRSIAREAACEWSRLALDMLRRLNPRQVQFKYCSTFDSTAEGNIGPVTEALMEAFKLDFTIAVPALPGNARTQYNGYLFIGEQLISETHMRHHPLNPMTEPNLVRHLQAQTARKVGLIAHAEVRAGAARIRQVADELRAGGVAIALVDAIDESDLAHIAEAFADAPLITGGSGLAITLPAVWRRKNLLAERSTAHRPPPASSAKKAGNSLIISGSCSAATLEQLRVLQASGCPLVRLNVERLMLMGAEAEIERLIGEARRALKAVGRVAVCSSAPISEREATMRQLRKRGVNADEAPSRIERAMGALARQALEDCDIQTLIVAGGETSGAVIDALEAQAVEILDTIEPGAPGLQTIGNLDLKLALKSGNFGSPDFFLRALAQLN